VRYPFNAVSPIYASMIEDHQFSIELLNVSNEEVFFT
jgi:hypothetical protein